MSHLQEADVVVIGVGVAGIALTYHLANEVANVILLERGYLGDGASGATMSNLNLHNRLPRIEMNLALYTMRLYQNFMNTFETDIEYEKTSNFLLLTNKELIPWAKKRVLAQQQSGLGIYILPRKDLDRVDPFISPSIEVAVLCRDSSWLNPFALCRGFIREAKKAGARVFFILESLV